MAKVLIVDDDLYIRELYEEVLKGEGYEVETAENGQQGLDQLQQGGYDAVLLDMMMPKIDGLGILESLAKNPPPKKNGPVLLLSNLGHETVVKRALTLGASGYLIKANITPDLIVNKLKSLFEENSTSLER